MHTITEMSRNLLEYIVKIGEPGKNFRRNVLKWLTSTRSHTIL